MSTSFVAIDIGNSAIHGALARSGPDGWTVDAPQTLADVDALLRLAEQAPDGAAWWAVSVNRERSERLRTWLAEHRPNDRLRLLAHADVSMPLGVTEPERLGMDRVAAAVAANARRPADSAAIIVDSGTAITVDAVDRRGAFLGGAILPGVGMSAAALDRGTDALPRIVPLDTPPEPIGRNTELAIRSGLYWGSFGAVKELIERQRSVLDSESVLFLTGGAAVWAELLHEAQLAPNLTLHGVALLAAARPESAS